MNEYLRSIGFSKIKNESEMLTLLDEFYKNKENIKNRKLVESLGVKYFRMNMNLDKNEKIGISIYGTYENIADTKDKVIIRQGYYPYLIGDSISSEAKCSIQKKTALNEFLAIIDDIKNGISVIFRLINPEDYLFAKFLCGDKLVSKEVYLSALCKDAKILLPSYKNQKQLEKIKITTKKRQELIDAAKKGDEDAIETLSYEDMQSYNMFQKRLGTEDLYSVVDSVFVPHGLECDLYSVLGDILDFEIITNEITKEEIYNIKISCNDIILNVAVNTCDVLGEVKVGRRFKGEIWLQGFLRFIALGIENISLTDDFSL